MYHLRKESPLYNGVSGRSDLSELFNYPPGPKITAFQSMMLSGHGLPEIPPGGSVERRLKSRIRRLLQFVDYRERLFNTSRAITTETHHYNRGR